MKHWNAFLVLLACASLVGCASRERSISNSAYRENRACHPYVRITPTSDPAFAYQGELSEFDILGITRGEITSETEIRRALDTATQVELRPGSAVLLIQSGAMFPDGPMISQLSKTFRVLPFSGIPPAPSGRSGEATGAFDPETYSKSLRLSAARAGAETIICYWGMLESQTANLATKTVSWVPVMNWILPDEKQHMRLRLKMALVDVRTGSWSVFSPEPAEDARLSRSPRRGAVDQKQVEYLKQIAYEAGAKDLVRHYSRNFEP